jgi:hypothetical protein
LNNPVVPTLTAEGTAVAASPAAKTATPEATTGAP